MFLGHRFSLLPLNYIPMSCIVPFSTLDYEDAYVGTAKNFNQNLGGSMRFFKLCITGQFFCNNDADTGNLHLRRVYVDRSVGSVVLCHDGFSDVCSKKGYSQVQNNSKHGGVKPFSHQGSCFGDFSGQRVLTGDYCDRLNDNVIISMYEIGSRRVGLLMRLPIREQTTCVASVVVDGLPRLGSFVVIGTVNDSSEQTVSRRGNLRVFRLVEASGFFELLHRTKITGVATALSSFHGRVLAGLGDLICLYEMGRKCLLRKCGFFYEGCFATVLRHEGRRLFVADVQDSVFLLKYHPRRNVIIQYADDCVSRFVVSLGILDYDTVAVGDKFGNFAILRVPVDISHMIEEDVTDGYEFVSGYGITPFKFEMVCSYYVGDVVTSILAYNYSSRSIKFEVMIFSTLGGDLGVLLPLTKAEDVDLFQHVEIYMRQECQPFLGWSHLSFRSYYFPCRNVIDGDLCESYTSLCLSKQCSIAESMKYSPGEISNSLEDVHQRAGRTFTQA